MAAGTLTKTGQLEHDCLCQVLYGAYTYFALNNGEIWRYTIASGVLAKLGSFPYEDIVPVCICTDNTNLFWGSNKRGIHQTVIASGVTTLVGSLYDQPQSISYASNTLYITTKNGGIYTMATA